MPERSERIAVRVTEKRKKRWKEAASNGTGKYQNLSHMIISAVENELSGDYNNPTQGEEPVNVDMDGVHSRLDTVLEEIRDLGGQVEQVDASVSRASASAEMDIVDFVMDFVPSKGDVAGTSVDADAPAVDRAFNAGDEDGIIEFVSDAREWPREEVQSAVTRMGDEMDSVERLEGTDGRMRVVRT